MLCATLQDDLQLQPSTTSELFSMEPEQPEGTGVLIWSTCNNVKQTVNFRVSGRVSTAVWLRRPGGGGRV